MDTRKAQLGRKWQAHTDHHGRELARAEESFDAFKRGETVDPLAIVGAFRSGKTQLIYHLFDRSWNQNIPAFYIGDPGAMLEEFEQDDIQQLDHWIEHRIDEQLDAYAEGDADGIDWFPNIDSASKQEFVDSRPEFDSSSEVEQTALFFDEVEQSYRAFMRVMGQDDDNPLRKINDSLQDSIKIWSFGMISAFEFIGEADWGRMKEIRIPPLSVEQVRYMLADKRPEATFLANTIWWLARGRTGLIIKLVDELPSNIETKPEEWLRERAEANFKDTRLINSIWTSLDRKEWDKALSALLFNREALDTWVEQDDAALTWKQCQEATINIVQNQGDFSGTDAWSDAITLLDRNVARVFQGLAVGDSGYFPRYGLADEVEADALLDLISNMIVSFEPSSPERSVALETTDNLKGEFQTEWLKEISNLETIEESITTPKPSKIRDAFPPIAVNPDRVCNRSETHLRESMERGLELSFGSDHKDRATIRFCPTKQTVSTELKTVTNNPDLTSPTLLVLPEEMDVETSSEIETYLNHSLLTIERHQSSRFWAFVLNLYGRLEQTGHFEPYYIDEKTKQDLVSDIEEREVRNTIETLYDQLNQVAIDTIDPFIETYYDQYSLSNSNTLIWEESRLSSASPFWTNGRIAEPTVALSYLLVIGPEYETQRQYSELHNYIEQGMAQKLVSGGQTGFGYKEYYDDLFAQSGYSQRVTEERHHYVPGGKLDPGMRRLEDALTSLAGHVDLNRLIKSLNNPDKDAKNGEIPVIGVNNLPEQAYPLLRAILIRGLVTGSSPKIDVVQNLTKVVDDLEDNLTTIDGYLESIEAKANQLESPDAVTVGEWITVTTDRLDQYKNNLSRIVTATEDLIKRCEVGSGSEPIGYHYWFFLNMYRSNIQDNIDDFKSDIDATSIEHINDARNLFSEAYKQVENSESVPLHFGSREVLLAELEEFGDEIFDLKSTIAAPSLSLPEDREDLHLLNDHAKGYIEELQQLNDDLETIEQQSEAVREALDETKAELRELLTRKEMNINE
ncbi:hypothetical protein [Halalkalirubrum salinum]|uniref:hypothetical protein n=1 Tax=Halalkalirubrum salinum TaxID=2563889 RepID=UPI0010FB229C|nr:hypothetical protein [Halalkalirubrum salinum]